MTRRDKAILALVCAAEIINCAKAGVLKSRITDLETQRDIYASRAQHWIDRAVEDEEVIDSMQLRLDALADGKVKLEDTRANAEICLLGVTPGFKPAAQIKSHAVHQVIESPVEEHSKKPEETRRRIVELLGDVPRIELFARQRSPGWDAWGNEIGEQDEK